jgi:hypothetical protein
MEAILCVLNADIGASAGGKSSRCRILTDGPAKIAPGEDSPDFADYRRQRRSPGPSVSANRTRTRGFRAILRNLPKAKDWLVEQSGFEPATPPTILLGEIVRDFGRVFERENGRSAAENLIAGNSPRIPNLRALNLASPFGLS